MNTPEVRFIVVDLDGTLLNSQHELSPCTERALKAVIAGGVPVALATGKTHHSAQGIIRRLGLTTPGVYLQGLTIFDADGVLRYQQTHDPVAAQGAVRYAEANGHTTIIYSGMRILVRERNHETDMLLAYGEPEPETVGPLTALAGSIPVNKVIVVDTVERVKSARAQLQAQLDGQVTLVQALDHMLEILPPGTSKGKGVQKLLEMVGVSPEHVLAMGDAENDIEMLQLAGVAVAMGQAKPAVKAVADYITASNDEDGVAQAVAHFLPDLFQQ